MFWLKFLNKELSKVKLGTWLFLLKLSFSHWDHFCCQLEWMECFHYLLLLEEFVFWFLNIMCVYQADQSPNTNLSSQAKFFIFFYTYYVGHFWPKNLLIYAWTWKLIWPTSPLRTPGYTLFKGKIPIQSTSKSRHKSTKFLAKNDPHNMCKNI